VCWHLGNFAIFRLKGESTYSVGYIETDENGPWVDDIPSKWKCMLKNACMSSEDVFFFRSAEEIAAICMALHGFYLAETFKADYPPVSRE